MSRLPPPPPPLLPATSPPVRRRALQQIDEQAILHAITPDKDVDGLHPTNVAALCAGRTRSGGAVSFELEDLEFHVPCTPQVRRAIASRIDYFLSSAFKLRAG